MDISPGMALGIGAAFVLVVVGVYMVTKEDAPATPPPGFSPYPTPATPPPAQDDTAQAVRAGLSFAETLVQRFAPSASDRLAAEQRDADRALERERLRLCLATPTAPICNQNAGGLANRT